MLKISNNLHAKIERRRRNSRRINLEIKTEAEVHDYEMEMVLMKSTLSSITIAGKEIASNEEF